MKPIIPCIALALAACNPDLAVPEGTCQDATGEEEPGALRVTLEPAAPLDAAPPILRLRVGAAEGVPDPERLVLVEGEVGSAHLGQIARDDVSAALAERIVPALVWAEGDELVVAPNRVLAPGSYSVASGAPKASVPLLVAEDDPLPHLELVFPPNGESAGGRLAVWCAPSPLAPLAKLATPIVLSPSGEEALLANGAVGDSGARCAHLVTAAAGIDPVVAPPALVGDDGAAVARLDPVALRGGAAPPTWTSRACEAGELALGPGCAQVFDDRMLLLPPAEAPLLWAIEAPGLDLVLQSDGAPMLLSPLAPATSLTLAASVLDVGGHVAHHRVSIVTLPPMPHVVVNEVLANPMGQEPEQEWVELYNDGLAVAELATYTLADGSGAIGLPPAQLAPGGYALVVDEAFDALADSDPRPPEGTLLLRVPELGENGLSNEGEPLTLRDQGVVVSRFPAAPKPKAGRSVMRISPKAIDEVPESFTLSAELPTPGAANL